tara:strand:- start:3089 stop:3622 length:534 start_codon:yes stop_codon:yes gene_type:complete
MTKPPEPGPCAEDLIIPVRHTPLDVVLLQAATGGDTHRQSSDRITAKVQIYHEPHGEGPMQAQATFSGMLDSRHQVYQRRQTVGPHWSKLDIGWVPEGDVGYVLLENRKPTYQNTPGDEVAAIDSQRIIYVRLGGVEESAGWVMRPGRLFMAEAGADTIYVRSDVIHTRLGVTIFPR